MSDNNSSGGISFCGLLTIVFITLKLTGYISWSWFWVLSPLLIPICFVLIVFLSMFALAAALHRKLPHLTYRKWK